MSFNLRPNILIGLICKFYPVKSIATITGTSTFLTNSNTFKNKLLQYIFKSINLIVFQNNNDKLMFDKLKIYQNKYSIVPGSGIDTSYYNHKRDYKKKEYTNFIFIARIIKEKGILEFIKAAEIVKKKGYSANFKILGSFYLGGKKNDRIDKSVIEFAAKSNLIEYLGETKNVIPYISAQILGGVLASSALYLLLRENFALVSDVSYLGATLPSGSVSQSFGFGKLLRNSVAENCAGVAGA